MGHATAVTSLLFCSDQKTFFSSSMDGSISVWQLDAEKPMKTISIDGVLESRVVLQPDLLRCRVWSDLPRLHARR